MPSQKITQQLKNLYKEAFPTDSDAFVEYFFDTQIKKERLKNVEIVFADNNVDIASTGYIIKKPAVLHNKRQPAHYLTAFATHTAHRNKGYANKLMQQILQRLHKKEVSFCFLYPFNHTFYLKYGFSTISYASELQLNGNINCQQRTSTNEEELFKIAKLSKLANKKNLADNYLICSKQKITEKIKEFACDNIFPTIYSIEDSTAKTAKDFAFCFKSKNRIHYYKSLDNNLFFNLACNSGLKAHDFTSTDINASANNQNQYIQARITNVAAALKNAPFIIEDKFSIKIIDNIVPQNNAVFLINNLVNNSVNNLPNGTSNKTLPQQIQSNSADYTLNINELTQLLLCGDNKLIKKQKTYLDEQF